MVKTKNEEIDLKQQYLFVRAMFGSIKKRCVDEEIAKIDELKALATDISITIDAGSRLENLYVLQTKLNKFYAEEKQKFDTMKTQVFDAESGEDRIMAKFEYSRVLRITYSLPRISSSIQKIIDLEKIEIAKQQNASEIIMQ